MARWAEARVIRWVVLLSITVCPACGLFTTSGDKFHAGEGSPTDADVDGHDAETASPLPSDAPCDSEGDEASAPDALFTGDAESVEDAPLVPDAVADVSVTSSTATSSQSEGRSHTVTGTDTSTVATVDAGTTSNNVTSSSIARATGSASASASATTTGGSTNTRTTTPPTTSSGSASGTGSQTASRTATVTVSNTQTGTGTNTLTSSNTLSSSGTRTGSTTVTSTVTGASSASGTQTGTTSRTLTTTGTLTTTSTVGTTGTRTGSSTGTGTGSTSATATPTVTTTATSTVPVTSVGLDKTVATVTLPGTSQLTATVLPTNATNRAVIWSSSNSAVASVSNSGLVTAVGTGTATITVTTVDGAKTATCNVTVVISVTSVALDIVVATIGLGQTITLTTTVLPGTATNKTLFWSSSDAKVASVEATGASAVVTALVAGSTTITVKSQDGDKTATCVVTVALSAQWVRTPTAAGAPSNFAALALDGSGNIYAAGSIKSADLVSFSSTVSLAGSSTSQNAVLVKYATDGTVLWARTVTGTTGASLFTGVAVDATGNLFAVGTISGSNSYNFGNSVVATGAYAFGTNLVLVKYDGNGTAQWARTVSSTNTTTSYAAVATDASGNVYATGAITGPSLCNLGNSVSVSGTVTSGKNALLVKYNSAGVAQWARSQRSGSGESSFTGVATDGTGHVYVVGSVAENLSFGFGGLATSKGSATVNALLVQYTVDGVAQWARTATSGGKNSSLAAVAIGGAGDVYVAGGINGNAADDFGSGVTVAGAYPAGTSILLLKYDSSGIARWGRSVVSATGLSRFASLAVDATDHVYAAGIIAGPASYDFGSQITATATSNGNEILLMKYDSTGACLRAQTAATGSSNSAFSSVGVDDDTGAVYAAGYVSGTNPVDFGNGIRATSAYSGGTNAMLVKYR